MCIRDSLVAAHSARFVDAIVALGYPDYLPRLHKELLQVIAKYVEIDEAVSYTHLDVYKRQVRFW